MQQCKHLRVSPVDKDGDGNDDNKDKADHHGDHLMHCYCACEGEKDRRSVHCSLHRRVLVKNRYHQGGNLKVSLGKN